MAAQASRLDENGKRIPLHDWALAEIAKLIQRRDLRPGERLIESDIAAQLRISRGPVREAIRQLATNGVLTIEPMKGARVARIDDEDPIEMMEVSAILFGYAARRASKFRTNADIAHLQQVAQKIAADSQRDDTTPRDHLANSDAVFRAILEAAHSKHLRDRLLNLVHFGPFGLYAQYSMESKEARITGADCYVKIANAIMDGKPIEAEQASFALHKKALAIQGIDLDLHSA